MAKTCPQVKYILLMRHPGAVALSQLRGGWELNSIDLLQELRPNFPWLKDAQLPKNQFQRLSLWWALENMVALKASSKPNVKVVLYEHILMERETVCHNLAKHCQFVLSKERLSNAERPSEVSVAGLEYKDSTQRMQRWMQHVSDDDKAYLDSTLKSTGLSRYYSAFEAQPLLSFNETNLNTNKIN